MQPSLHRKGIGGREPCVGSLDRAFGDVVLGLELLRLEYDLRVGETIQPDDGRIKRTLRACSTLIDARDVGERI